MSTTQTPHWQVNRSGDDVMVEIEGEITEDVDFAPLEEELTDIGGTLTFDLSGIGRLNSSGVRHWVNFMRALGEKKTKEILYERCSVPIVDQINMINDFQGTAKIVSIYAPYLNEETDDETQKLLQVADIEDPTNPPTFKDADGRLWELDELPERFFAFLLYKASSTD